MAGEVTYRLLLDSRDFEMGLEQVSNRSRGDFSSGACVVAVDPSRPLDVASPRPLL
jgi:hypothetical protein